MLTGPPHNNAHCSDRKKEDMVDDDRICREGGEGDEPSVGGSRGRRRGRGRSSGISLDGTRGAGGGGGRGATDNGGRRLGDYGRH
jgi:hypothetical protein